MDGRLSISPLELYAAVGTSTAPVIIDAMRLVGTRPPLFAAPEWMLVSRTRHYGLGQTRAAASTEGRCRFSQLVIRERPKIDRIACPWLIRRFIDPEAGFLYVPTDRVFDVAATTGATAYDIPGAEPFSHAGELCSFDAFLRVYDIRDPALDTLAVIVRGADTARLDLAPQAAGLAALSLGLSADFPDDHAMLEHGLVMYDAFHAWCRSCQGEIYHFDSLDV